MKYWSYVGPVPGTEDRIIYVQCAFPGAENCKKKLKYHIRESTTSNLREHLKNIHAFKDLDENSKTGCKRVKKAKSSQPFNAYD